MYINTAIPCKTNAYKGLFIVSVRQDIEILNLWEDFKKVVKFIDDNFEWLNPLMEHITHRKQSLE